MCGRAYSTITDEELEIRYTIRHNAVRWPKRVANFNICPTQEIPIVTLENGERQLTLMRWGLIPSWAKDTKISYSTINARSETVAEKPAFREAFRRRRCIVPLSGFFEWRREGQSKQPFRISLIKDPILSIAGIWETNLSFSVLTTEANSFMRAIHDRMPVILDDRDFDRWLNPEFKDLESLQAILKPCPSDQLQAVEISTLVNSPKNNRAEILEPIKTIV